MTQMLTRKAPRRADQDHEGESLTKRVLNNTATWTTVVLVVLFILFTISNPEAFLSEANINNIAVSTSVLLVMAVGQTLVLIAGAFDLSVGAVAVLSGVISAKFLLHVNSGSTGTLIIAALISVGVGCVCGVINGLIVSRLNVSPLVATLGTMGIATGVALLLTNGQDLSGIPIQLQDTIGLGNIVPHVPYLVCIALLVVLVGQITLTYTRFGRRTFAVGSNAEAARRAGIRVDNHLTIVYAVAGALAGLAGYLFLAQFGTTTLASHNTDNLQTITAAILGGTSLYGGIGSIIGTTVGALIPGTLQSGFVIAGVQPYWQQVGVGIIVILAVYADQLRRRGGS